MSKRIMIFPGESESGLEIMRSIGNSLQFEIVGASSIRHSHGEYVYKEFINNLPYVTDKNFIEKINLIIKEKNIDFIYPAHDQIVLKLSKYKNNILCDIIASPYETCEICFSKKKTYDVFKNIINVPVIYRGIDEVKKFPVFMKPNVGHGSIGTHIINSFEDFDFYSKCTDYLLLEYLPGKEYTVDCFTDKKGNLAFVGGRERNRIFAGISANIIPVNDKRFYQLADRINSTIKLRGAWFFQVKERDNKELVLMEIEPRIPSGMGLYRNLGINLPLMSIFDKMGMNISIIRNSFNLTMDRALDCAYKTNLYYENVYIDFDGTITINNKVNTKIMQFIFQCINNGKKIYLLTKHEYDLNKTLRKYRLQNLFDDIIWIELEDSKYKYINKPNSIFIENSYKERKKVHDKLGIPVFDVNAVDCLIDYKL